MKDDVIRDPIPYGTLVRVCASVTAGAGIAALIGWASGLPSLTSLGSGRIPMAPSTALLFVLYGIAIFLRARPTLGRGAHRVGLAVSIAGALFALLVLFLSSLGIHAKAEHLGFPIAGTVGGAPAGHMSPVAALFFLLASLSFLASFPSPSNRPRRTMAAWCLACLLIAACFVLLLAYLFGTPLFYVGSFIPPAATTCVAFAALGIALMALSGPQAWPLGEPVGEAARASYALVLVFVLLASGIVTAGHLYFRNFEKKFHNEVGRQLSAIADLKASELVRYRTERLGDAAIFSRNIAFSATVRRFLENPADGEAEGRLRELLGKFHLHKQYDQIRLLDAQGVTRMVIPASQPPVSAVISRRIQETLRSGEVTFQDFYRNEHDQRIYMAVLAPILDGKDERRAMGVLRFRIDPESYLYPFIRRWPTPSRSAESLLLRRDGNDALILNELKFRKNTALTLRVSLEGERENPAVKAVLGREGIVEGVDYRGVAVVADVRAVPGSPWYLVSRMDQSEVYAQVRERLWWLVVLVSVLLLGSAAGVGMVWRQQGVRHYRERYEAAERVQESERKFRTLFKGMTEGVALHEVVYGETGEAVDYRILNINLAYELHTGLSPERARGVLASELYGTGAPPYLAEYDRVARSGEPLVFETYFPPMKKHFSISAVSPKTGQFATVFEDITERIRREEELKQKTAELERFTYTVSHDLKSPLVTVKAFLGYLEQDLSRSDAGRIVKDMQYIRAAADKMGQLLDELLVMSRVGRVVHPPVRVTLRELVGEALGMVAGPIAERQVEVHVSDEDTLELIGDRPRLVEIWQNLVENAVKYMGDQASPRIEIGTERRGLDTVFFVRDNGMGIDPRHQAKVFGMFEKLDPLSEGTGLGLALVQRIVELYRGTIWLESKGPGQGACFLFTLPDAVMKQAKGVT